MLTAAVHIEHNQNTNTTFNHQRTLRIKIHDHSWVFHQSLKKQAVVETLVGTLSNYYDDDGSENISEEMNLRLFKLYRV